MLVDLSQSHLSLDTPYLFAPGFQPLLLGFVMFGGVFVGYFTPFLLLRFSLFVSKIWDPALGGSGIQEQGIVSFKP